MPVYNSKNLIDNLQQQTEGFLKKATYGWPLISSAKLLQQPGENKWSAAQCIWHLNSYGHYYLPEIEKAIETAKQNRWPAKKEFKAGWMGNYFTQLMMPGVEGKKMKKMSSPKNHIPDAALNTNAVIKEFIEQQEKTLLLLERAREINLEKAKVPISIAKFIKLKLGDTFMFLIAHNYRHVLQAERALAPSLKEGERQAIAT